MQTSTIGAALKIAFSLVLLMALEGCPAPSTSDASMDGAAERDSALERDATQMDAMPDQGAPDGGDLFDARTDASDVEVGSSPLDAQASDRNCVVNTEACNRFDDDCDGQIDEDACGNCEAFTRGGEETTVYLACPSPVPGVAVLGDACGSVAGVGYRPVDLDSTNEQLFLEARAQMDSAQYWVGLHRDGATWRYRDGTTVDASSVSWSSSSLDRGDCALVTSDGAITTSCFGRLFEFPFLCEASALSGPFTETTSEACNGIDDDDDGLVDDENACGMEALTILDHVYYVNTALLTWFNARAACPSGSELVRIDSELENQGVSAWVGPLESITRWVWMDLRYRQSGDAGTSGAWRWSDGTPVWMGQLRTEGATSLVPFPTFVPSQPNETECEARGCRGTPTEGCGDICGMYGTLFAEGWFDGCCSVIESASICERQPVIGP